MGPKPHSRRRRGRSPVRWSDLLDAHYTHWPDRAMDRDLWKSGEIYFAVNSWAVLRGEAGGRQQYLQDDGHCIASVREAARQHASSPSSSSTSNSSSSSSHVVSSLACSSDTAASKQGRETRLAPKFCRRTRRKVDLWVDFAVAPTGAHNSLNDFLLPALDLPPGFRSWFEFV